MRRALWGYMRLYKRYISEIFFFRNRVDQTSVCVCVCLSVSVCVSVRGHNCCVCWSILMIFGYMVYIGGTSRPFLNFSKILIFYPLAGVKTLKIAPICPNYIFICVRSDNSSVTGPIFLIFGYVTSIHGTPRPFFHFWKISIFTPHKGVNTPNLPQLYVSAAITPVLLCRFCSYSDMLRVYMVPPDPFSIFEKFPLLPPARG